MIELSAIAAIAYAVVIILLTVVIMLSVLQFNATRHNKDKQERIAHVYCSNCQEWHENRGNIITWYSPVKHTKKKKKNAEERPRRRVTFY